MNFANNYTDNPQQSTKFKQNSNKIQTIQQKSTRNQQRINNRSTTDQQRINKNQQRINRKTTLKQPITNKANNIYQP